MKKANLAECLEVWSWSPVKGLHTELRCVGRDTEIRFTNLFTNAIWHHRLTSIWKQAKNNFSAVLRKVLLTVLYVFSKFSLR